VTNLRLATNEGDGARVRVIAFYLPQFHPIPENDAWWGSGFTEWTNVAKARPNFVGHRQPDLPGELGFYDLRVPETREAQAGLAREHGVDAFCYYWYWFGGKRLLERPLDEVVASGRPDFPFCVCWANENWTRRWDGREHEVLLAQTYSEQDAAALVETLVPLFRDRRYVRVDGRALFLVYRPMTIPALAQQVQLWRDYARRAGAGELYLAGVQRNAFDNPAPFGFDAAVEFPPIGHTAENVAPRIRPLNPAFRGSVFHYRGLIADYLTRPRPRFRQFRGVTPGWDNTARRQDDGMAFIGSSPELFGYWAELTLRQTQLRHHGDERLLFVNAWNEWAEGNHLEPDERHGRRYLEALRDARARATASPPSRPSWEAMRVEAATALAAATVERHGATDAAPAVSVVMPIYNHAAYLQRALASIAAQARDVDLELVAVDDGSADASADIVVSFARGAGFPVTLVRQSNAGAHAALNRGMTLARGATIALANSDDAYVDGRLAALRAALDANDALLAFSATEFVDDDDRVVGDDSGYVRTLRDYIGRFATEELLRLIIQVNVAISTGNFVFRRSLVDRIGGFAALAVCHDWDFLLAATYVTKVAFVPGKLYRYRVHGTNTFSGARLVGHVEGDLVLHRFFAGIADHPWLTDPVRRASFLAYAATIGLAGFLPAEVRAALAALPRFIAV
jgi:glycosyltransferase involved in cell wall biosynthesis